MTRQLRRPFPLAARARESWPGSEVVVLNDVTAAGYAAVADGLRDFCIVTVSSGVGNKIFVNGEPALGAGGRGGEIGHWRVSREPDAPICDCGEQGHLGAMASGRGVLHTVHRRAEEDRRGFTSSLLGVEAAGEASEVDNPAIARSFHRKNPWTTAIIREAAGCLAGALALVHAAIGVECFLIFGGFAIALGDEYLRLLADEAGARCWKLGQDWTKMIRPGRFADDSGLIGAGYFACNRSQGLPR